ncbi:lipopolysaccharide/colanic/teichoic acid biosynthesis glycosyltransferase [Mucilaginibacter yixingensis]|uniref:Lipopolysaccharide/colanic/teichoic acid biosynthesis glycosyltransferase n=1 Tax=Mucilaginibacter yixingensis TaxID=1295612 RepID=A0A2T5J9C6_9SPHI|nr:sugar transferase [Mucilaginibacter yixingensis]PTQ96682.1 lipopolysaccharide/colanic/teichoic acid biosynthesis glycosyltransferase [Mucilaginibacter yixingensis]
MLLKRTFDFAAALCCLIVLLPVLPVIAILIAIDSPGGVFFKQVRVGQNKRLFLLYKFRTMRTDSEKSGQLTVGEHDSRITAVGYWLRKYKIDELPQLLNVLKGDMSLVGPRPEVEKYVNLYSAEESKVLSVKPGITDCASINHFNENELLNATPDPETTYIKEIMPLKIKQSLAYINQRSFTKDLAVIVQTLKRCVIS